MGIDHFSVERVMWEMKVGKERGPVLRSRRAVFKEI
jgi:hypothetical protein